MICRLLNVLTAVSVPLCVAAGDGDHGDLSRAFELRSGAGVFAVSVSDHENRYRADEAIPPGPPRWQFFHWTGGPPPMRETSPWGWRWRWAGLSVGVERFRGNQAGTDTRFIALPYWLVMSAGVVSLYLGVLPRLRRSKRPGLCPRCGYDLRATPGRCPECGLAA